MTAEIEVEISIEPCSITSLVNTTPFSDVTYQLGTSGFTFGDYIYDQITSDDCDNPYDIQFTVTGLPSPVTHDETNSRFEIAESVDIDSIGRHTVTVTATITYPTDSSNNNFVTVTSDD